MRGNRRKVATLHRTNNKEYFDELAEILQAVRNAQCGHGGADINCGGSYDWVAANE
jgi:hypothetical protein